MPVVDYKSNAKPSMFAYPAPIEVAKKEEKERVATAILSVTAKAKKREAEKAKAAATDKGSKKGKIQRKTFEKRLGESFRNGFIFCWLL